MQERSPAVAGRFYPAETDQCNGEMAACLAGVELPEALPRRIVAGIVPHAGWVCSGRVAGAVFQAIARAEAPDTFVLFGAAHRATRSLGTGAGGAMYGAGAWSTPVGSVRIDEHLAERIKDQGDVVVDDPSAHSVEHSLEVQLPFIKRMFPESAVVPIIVASSGSAPAVGRAVAKAIATAEGSVIVVGTTDLTHYGPSYGFTPEGPGQDGRTWAKEVNDRQMIELILSMNADRVVPEAAEKHNACGGGAVAATMTAAVTLGAERAVLLSHTTSHEVLRDGSTKDAVGYAGIVFGSD